MPSGTHDQANEISDPCATAHIRVIFQLQVRRKNAWPMGRVQSPQSSHY